MSAVGDGVARHPLDRRPAALSTPQPRRFRKGPATTVFTPRPATAGPSRSVALHHTAFSLSKDTFWAAGAYNIDMRPKGTAADLERRRRRAVQLLEEGESPAVVARILGVQPSSLHRWRRMAHQDQGLTAKPATGAKRRLTDLQLSELEGLLNKGAPFHGYPNELWTADRVAEVIKLRFGVEYHAEHVRKILKRRLNWTSHKPQGELTPVFLYFAF